MTDCSTCSHSATCMYYRSTLPDGTPHAAVMFPIRCIFYNRAEQTATEEEAPKMTEIEELKRLVEDFCEYASDAICKLKGGAK